MYQRFTMTLALLFWTALGWGQAREGVGLNTDPTPQGAAGSGIAIYFSEDFSGGTIPTDWTNADPSGNNALWTHCADPTSGQVNGCPAIWEDALNAQGPFAATTARNGFVTMDSDAVGNIQSDHLSQLTTPSIDLSAASQVVVSFQSHIGVWSVPAEDGALLRVSVDGGLNWTEYTLFPGLVPGSPAPPLVRWSYNPTHHQVDISAVAAGQAEVMLQWQWQGRFEFLWSLDDVVVSDRFVYFEEDFSDGAMPAGWLTEDASGNNAVWTHCDDPTAGIGGHNNGCARIWDDGLNAQGPFAATTATNGFVNMDSDLAGDVTHFSQLTTPALDFTRASEVGVSFEGHIGVWSIDAEVGALLRVSNDDGVNWTEYMIYPGLVTGSPAPPLVRWSYNPSTTFIDISAVAAGQPRVLVQWQWEGNFEYNWKLDDVIFITQDPDLIYAQGFDLN